MSRRVSGEILTNRVCREIIRSGLDNVLTARFVPEGPAIRVGLLNENGAIDCGVDYPAEPERIHEVVENFHHYAIAHYGKLQRCPRGALKQAA